ncbi:hypothetical protein GPALN_005595 [Globodera pallida]|nr:hypothetical protein GPALN_005595 [Globodera pallida]
MMEWRERHRSSSKSSDLASSSSTFHSSLNYLNCADFDINPTLVQESVAPECTASMEREKMSGGAKLFPIKALSAVHVAQPHPNLRWTPSSVNSNSNSITASTSAETNSSSDVSKADIEREYQRISKFLGPIETPKKSATGSSSGITTSSMPMNAPKQTENDDLMNQIRGLTDQVDRCNNNTNKIVDVCKELSKKIYKMEREHGNELKEHDNKFKEMTNSMKELEDENKVLELKVKVMEEQFAILCEDFYA